jgi:signal transduction histidine kinase
VTERPGYPGIRRSVFAKLLAIMAAMAASLLGMVAIFFWLVVSSNAVAHGEYNLPAVHAVLFSLLLVFIAGVVFTTHLVIRRLLRPLRSLGDGVARLSAGELDVVVPGTTGDEFGLLSAAFNEMVARVREMVRARDQLLLDVSHELRSPLTRMKVALELTPEGINRTRMAADVAEMEAMVGELLELERLRDGRGLAMAPTDLVPILQDVAEGVRGRTPGVRLVPASGEVVALADADRVRTVVRNLVENALKYSLPDSAPVTIQAALHADTVSVTVADDGPGIPVADLGSLFEPFFRVDRSRSKKTGGYGLGLSICKRIVEAHGGALSVENLSPRGARFTVTLPRRQAERA